ncbi:hypothetical protein V8C35DRAFT_332512 [Trichoderma chlorosporum]
MTKVHRHGFTRLGKDGIRDDLYQFNIVFVHGLRGHPRKTWGRNADDDCDNQTTLNTHRNTFISSLFRSRQQTSTADDSNSSHDPRTNQPFWPDEFLTQDIPEARVWTYGYNADVIEGIFQANNKNHISHHGRDLAQPVIFIAHSLGGVVVKDAIRRSAKCQSQTRFIVFYGTPHRGSALAGWGATASKLARLGLQDANKKLIQTLQVDSEILDNIQEEFKKYADTYRFKIHSFQEARGVLGIKGLDGKVVDDFSSKVDLSSALETVESIDADHRQMVKCTNRDDVRYRTILSVLKQCIRSGWLGTLSTLPARPESPLHCAKAEEKTAATSAQNVMDYHVQMSYSKDNRHGITRPLVTVLQEESTPSKCIERFETSSKSNLPSKVISQTDGSILSQRRKEQIRLHLVQNWTSPALLQAPRDVPICARLEIVLLHIRTYYTIGNFDPTPKVQKLRFWKDVANSIYFFRVSDFEKARKLLQDTVTANSDDLFTQAPTTVLIEILSTLSPINTAANPDVRKAILQYLNFLVAQQLPQVNPIAFVLRTLHEGMDSKDWSLQALTFIADRLCAILEPNNELRLLAQHRLIALMRRGGDYDQALNVCKVALNDIRKTTGPGSLQERKMARQLEHIYIDQHDWVSALDQCFEIVGQRFSNSISPNPDPQYHDECSVWTMEDIAKIWELNGNSDQAIAWLKQARISGGIVWGPEVALEHIQDKLMELFIRCGKTEEAILSIKQLYDSLVES